jgi:hypothetical protein
MIQPRKNMKNILTELGRSLVATIFFAILLCGLYPLVVFGVSQLLFPHQANGSLLVDKSGVVRASALLAQNFIRARRRPARTDLTPPVPAAAIWVRRHPIWWPISRKISPPTVPTTASRRTPRFPPTP